VEGDKKMEFERFEDYKVRLIRLYDCKKYNEIIDECNKMIKISKKQKSIDTRQHISYSNFMLAKYTKIVYGYKKLNKVIEYIQQSIKYFYLDSEYIKSIWMLAVYYTMSNQTEKSIRIYERCIYYYKEIGNKFLLANVMHNKALLELNQKDMENSIKILETLKDDDFAKEGYNRENLMNEAYESMVKIYTHQYLINKSEILYGKMMRVLHKITDTSTKESLRQHLLSSFKIA
jgi:tetratricopeptide (TPR) repeat protein